MEIFNTKEKIINLLKEKSVLKLKIYDNTLATFRVLNQIAKTLIEEFKMKLEGADDRIVLEYKMRSEYEFEIRVASDSLIFVLHSNVFDFDKEHEIWKSNYVQNNLHSTFTGIISIYNFLHDSFKYKRKDDVGYLIGRIFINKDKHFFVEGKRQLGFLYNDFSNSIIDTHILKNIVESAILYTLDFDLFVPQYDKVKLVTVEQIEKKISNSTAKAGKRLGYKFYVESNI